MAIYSGKKVKIGRPVADVYDKISDLTQYASLVESVPDEMRSYLKDVSFEGDTIKITVPAIGAMTFSVTERKAPSHVGLKAEGAPVPLVLAIDLAEEGDATLLTPSLNLEIPAMLRPMVGGKVQELADKFGDFFGGIFNK